MWDEFDTPGDYRSDDAKLLQLPKSAQGPTYFRWASAPDEATSVVVALFVDHGSNWSARSPFARLAVLVDGVPTAQSMDAAELELFAGSLLDEIDRRKNLDVTVTPDASEAAVVPHRLATTIPTDQLSRLVTALLDAADSLEIYRRSGVMRPRNPDT